MTASAVVCAPTKTCTECKLEQPRSEFPKNRQTKDGLKSHCKTCTRRRAKARYHANRDSDIVARRAARAADPEKFRAIERRNYHKDPEKARARNRDRYHRAHREADPESLAFANEVLRKDPCCYCGHRETATAPHIDHIVPLEEGGEPDWTNLTSSCRRCNLVKGERPLLIFLLDETRRTELVAA